MSEPSDGSSGPQQRERKGTMPSAQADDLKAASDAPEPPQVLDAPHPTPVALTDLEGALKTSSAPPGVTGTSASEPPTSEASQSTPSVLSVLAPHLTEEQQAARRKDKMIGLVIIGVTFVLCILLSLWGKEMAEPELSEPPRPPTTEGVVGWPNKVEVAASLPAARAATKRTLLRGIVAEHVSSDGTIDFEMTGASVRYAFQSGPGQGPQPPREPGTVPRRSFCGRQDVHIRRHGLVAEHDMPGFPCPAEIQKPLPDPGCSLQQIWQYMIDEKGVPTRRPARIEYYRSKAGPAFRFTLAGTQHRVSLYGDCSRELGPREGLGSVP